MVTSIIHRATGVILRRAGQEEQVTARGEVILSAGAIGSPDILWRSGIGPAAELADAGIAQLRAGHAAQHGIAFNQQRARQVDVTDDHGSVLLVVATGTAGLLAMRVANFMRGAGR